MSVGKARSSAKPGTVGRALDRNLALEVVRVTEAAALAAAAWVGRGDERGADMAATAAMRQALNQLSLVGTIVNGEGDDPALSLHTGERVGTGGDLAVDIALIALEGQTICARGAHNALAVVAITEGGGFLRVPTQMYMEKIAGGPDAPADAIDLDLPPEEVLRRVAAAKGCAVAELTVCVLDRPRHADLLGRLYEAGARVILIADGDVSGAIAVGLPEAGVDLYMGSGGAAQGVLAAAGLKCLGGRMQCRLLARSEAERQRCRQVGLEEFGRKYDVEDMARGEVMFAATGVTDGHILSGVRLEPRGRARSQSLVMRSRSGTVRMLTVRHDLAKRAGGSPS